MYPDIITPKSYPDRLRDPAYDPFGSMPKELPPHPRVMASGAQIARARELIKRCRWAARAFETLLENAKRDADLPDKLPVPAQVELNHRAISAAQRNALAWLLTDDAAYRDRALVAYRLLARAYPHWPLTGADTRAAGGGMNENRMIRRLAETYDLLAAGPLSEEDDALFREMLLDTRPVSDRCPHRACGNHNTCSLTGRLAVGCALGDREHIHDALYGCSDARGWRYGLIHQLRHDILSDGTHWERAPGYHFYTMMCMVEMVDMLLNVGVDLWHATLPAQHQSDGQDLHRAYEPKGMKCFKAMLDAPFYQAFPNRDLSLLHDSGLVNLRGAYIWGVIYDRAYEVYGDPKYAWLLNRMEKEYPPARREQPDLPMPLNTSTADLDFVRVSRCAYPAGSFSLKEDCSISVRGRHERGCSLFPVHGSAMLRSDPDDEQAIGAFLFWGPHSAGHMNPGSLHLDISARGRRITDAPRSSGYEDPNHLTWCRTTIAQNTVTVDERSMFPYDAETQAIWEADIWRDNVSDGVLECFQPEHVFKAVRASNENVYAGVRLDRTVLTTGEFVLDVYRALSDREHLLDWTMHCVGEPVLPTGAKPFRLGTRRGYDHLREAREIAVAGRSVSLEWISTKGRTRAIVLPPAGAKVIVALDPPPGQEELGEIEAVEPRTCVVVRARSAAALFLSFWTFDDSLDTTLECLEGAADRDVVLETRVSGEATRWRFPLHAGPVTKG